jgi:hypothetical protein
MSTQCVFKLPIYYAAQVRELGPDIDAALELTSSIYTPLLVGPDVRHSPYRDDVIRQFTSAFSADVSFLRSTQKMLRESCSLFRDNLVSQVLVMEADYAEKSWEAIRSETSFHRAYQYLEMGALDKLNRNAEFMHVKSWFTLASPMVALCTPLLSLLLTLLWLFVRGISVNVRDLVSSMVSTNTVGKVFVHFRLATTQHRMYLVGCAALYVMSIYQNVMASVTFYQNWQRIHAYVTHVHAFVRSVVVDMNVLCVGVRKFSAEYRDFAADLDGNVLPPLCDALNEMTHALKDGGHVSLGKLMAVFYKLRCDKKYAWGLNNAFGFYHYMACMRRMASHKLTAATFSKKKQHAPRFRGMYYPVHFGQGHVVNDVDLAKSMVLTGPNGAGKTTMLKSVFANLLLAQQFGVGCFAKLRFAPVHHFYSYLNIPDTSGRDSLFEAEARRCKEIIDAVTSSPAEERHFCIFDEIFSGTNPEEAVQGATAFVTYLQGTQCRFMMTTHYSALCKNVARKPLLQNCQMVSTGSDHTYELRTGISEEKAGCATLRAMVGGDMFVETPEIKVVPTGNTCPS